MRVLGKRPEPLYLPHLMTDYIIITGTSRGVGRKLAELAFQEGLSVLSLSRDSQAMREFAAQNPEQHEWLSADLSAPFALQEPLRQVLKRRGAPIALINNAGIVQRSPLEDLTEKSWRTQLSVNLDAPFALIQTVLPAMLAAFPKRPQSFSERRGAIINVSSISATLGSANSAAYCASKWAIEGLTKSIAESIKDSGVMCLSVQPGSIDTEMLRGSGFPPRMSPDDVAQVLLDYAIRQPIAFNGASIPMFGI